MIKEQNKKMISNTAMLYLLTFAKLILPLITFPFLTRILSVSSYGQMTYVKSCTNYMQLIVDFGFLLSATKDIARLTNNSEISKICSKVTYAKIFLSIICFIIYLIMIFFIPILKRDILFSILSLVPIFLSIFLFDYYFRGIEKMHIVAIRFTIAKLISVILTLMFIKNDNQLIYIPVFEILTTIGAVISTIIYLKKEKIKLIRINFVDVIDEIKKSFVFFLSDIASTAFTLINTFLIGILLSESDVAYWGVAYTLISAVQSMYNPISNGIYPTMVKTKSFKTIKRVLFIFMPIIILGIIFCYFAAPSIINIINGPQYIPSIKVFRGLLLLLLFSFPAIILGWPTLGAIDKDYEVTKTTIIASIVHVLGLAILIGTNNFNIFSIAIMRCITEGCLLIVRINYVVKYKQDFKVT
ncbi:oligosaccharide flippase family protein [Beduini massiliensis]|uniref:oligosaccharide flippase family protein n=1 Tax=Beduini massiliensis TaxID=1585974 RepID=UPI000694418E|nr:oligosaccharide flippase family protein [Beduini massiliensis]